MVRSFSAELKLKMPLSAKPSFFLGKRRFFLIPPSTPAYLTRDDPVQHWLATWESRGMPRGVIVMKVEGGVGWSSAA
jgi:hypothetical protein